MPQRNISWQGDTRYDLYVSDPGDLLQPDRHRAGRRRDPLCGLHRRMQREFQGISRLVQGMPAEEAIRRLRGIRCGSKPTSCPDQRSFALEEALRGAAQAG